jgi:hypothetical protein
VERACGVICDACNRNCSCPRRLNTGEGKALVGLTAEEIRHLLETCGRYDLGRKLEMALDLVADREAT